MDGAIGGFLQAFTAVSQQRFENQLAARRQQQEEMQFQRQSQLLQMRMQYEQQDQERQTQAFELDQKRRKLEIDALTRATGNAQVQEVQDMVDALGMTVQKQKFFEEQGNPEQAQLQKFLRNQITTRLKTAGPAMMGQPGAQVAPQEGGAAPPEEGAEPGFQPSVPPMQAAAPTGAAPSAPPAGQPAASPSFATPAFYKHVQTIKPGTPEARFTTPEGTTFQVVESPEEVTAFNQKQKNARALFGSDEEAAMFVPPVTAVSRVEAKAREMEINRAMREARMEEMQGKQQEEILQTADQQNAINQTIKDAKGTSRVTATPQGIAVTGFHIDNMARERQAIENLSANGQLNRTTLEAYNAAFGDAVDSALTTRPELQEALAQVSPGEFRIKDVAPSGAAPNLQVRAKTTLNDLMRMSDTFEQNGIPPSVRIRQSNPAELAGDFVQSLPEGSQLAKQAPMTGFTAPTTLNFPVDPQVADQVSAQVSKLNASLSRAIYDTPPSEREAMLDQARRTIAAATQTHWIGQTPLGERTGGGGASMLLANTIMGPGEAQRTRKGAATQDFKALQSILGKPTNVPIEAPPPSFRPGLEESVTPKPEFGAYKPGKPTSQGGMSPMSGKIAMMMMGAPADLAAANSAIDKVQKAKPADRPTVAKTSAESVKTEWADMTAEEKKTFKSRWGNTKSKWKEWKVDAATIKSIDDLVGK